MERRFKKDPILKERYHDFVSEYINMGHMTLISDEDETFRVYLPHHSVSKEDSTTTVLQVVFDGFSKTGLGFSHNDCLTVGPTIQQELFSF